MRKEYRKAVRELFAEGLARLAPSFERVSIKAPILFTGETVFRWQATPDLTGFIILAPSPSGHESFTVEVGWSSDGGFPQISMRPSFILGPDDPTPIDSPTGVVRLGDLHMRRDMSWTLPDPALERSGDLVALEASLQRIDPETALRDAEEPVQMAMEALEESGLPFLRAWVAARMGSGSSRGAHDG